MKMRKYVGPPSFRPKKAILFPVSENRKLPSKYCKVKITIYLGGIINKISVVAQKLSQGRKWWRLR
jgi:hypothetical protein